MIVQITLALIGFCSCFAAMPMDAFLHKLHVGVPAWMQEQADADLDRLSHQPVSLQKVSQFYEESAPDLNLVKFVIQNNQIHVESRNNEDGVNYRRAAFEEALRSIASVTRLPDVVFLISMHDGFTSPEGMPVFAMCKHTHDRWSILVPDFEALRERFQVLSGRDLTHYSPKWEKKKSKLIWRGSTAQNSLDGELMRADNAHRFSRVILCRFSNEYPKLVDAKFTVFAQGAETISWLQALGADKMSFKEQIQYKYHILVDGNVTAYSASGWKFFVNSLVFKPDSQWTQWYFRALQPFAHYVPVREDLADLITKIQWAKSHDGEASHIAANARSFALSHLTISDNLLYLYYIISRYSQIHFAN